jgi:hypothetical protein
MEKQELRRAFLGGVGGTGPDPAFVLLLLFWITLPLPRLHLATLAGQGIEARDLFLVLSYGAVVLRAGLARRLPAIDPYAVPAGVFLTTLAVLALCSPRPDAAALVKLAGFGAYVLSPVLAPVVVDTPRRFEIVISAGCVGLSIALFAALASAVVFFADPAGLGREAVCSWGALPPSPVPRVCWPFLNPNMLAGYLTLAAPLACFLLDRPRWRPAGIALLVGVVTTAPFTMSAEVGGLALALSFLVAVRLRHRTIAWTLRAAGSLVAGSLAIAVTSYVVDGRLRLWDGPRVSVWRGALETLREHPLVGRGYGSLVAYVTDPRAFGYDPDWQHSVTEGGWMDGHNVWLDVMGQAGAIGLATFVWLVVTVARRTRDIGEGATRFTLAAAIGGGFLYGGLFDALEEARHLWAMVGLVVTASCLFPRALDGGPSRCD